MTMTTEQAHPNYLVIGAWLANLMIAGVVLCEWKWGLPKHVIVMTVLALSTIKVTLVALYYMHLKTDQRLLVFIALAPFLLIALALCVVFSSHLVRL